MISLEPGRTSSYKQNHSHSKTKSINEHHSHNNSFINNNSYHKGPSKSRFVLSTSPNYNFSYNNHHNQHHDSEHNSTNYISIVKKLLPPINPKIVIMCLSWYVFSAISNNSTKSMLKKFNYPITVTEVQFLLNCCFCLIFFKISVSLDFLNLQKLFPIGTLPNLSKVPTVTKFATPTKFILMTTLPMGIFQFVGHIASHKATSIIPVSMVHTIKALAPLTTVLSYRILFKKNYKAVTYITLMPLMIGVMLSCCYNKSSNLQQNYASGLLYAFVSMLIFVSQNIFAKKILTIDNSEKNYLPLINSNSDLDLSINNNLKITNRNEKLDKLSILFYCSLIGFIFTLPVYTISELFNNKAFSLNQVTPAILSIMLLNGVSHFIQSLLAFHILGNISPVNYSIANIMKRIIVIIVAIFWESQTVSSLQGFGLCLTMFGLYSYDRWGSGKHQ